MPNFSRPIARPRGRSSVALASLVASLPLFMGCGGGGGGGSATVAPALGRLSVVVAWPTGTGRVVPANAQSIQVVVSRAGTTFDSKTLDRPTTTATFTDLPVGAVTITAKAYAGPAATGALLASATLSATVAADTTSNLGLTMASELASLVATPNSVSLAVGATTTVGISALNHDGQTVLLDPSTLTFASGATGTATVTNAGVVTAVAVGSATLTVTEADSGLTLNIPTTIVAAAGISPANPSLTVGDRVTLTAVGFGGAVNWSVQEPGGGTIASDGTYTAPKRKGTYHVIATGAGGAPTVTAAVTVTSGSGTVVVN